MTNEARTVMENAISHYGKEHQLLKMFEEIGEFQEAVCKKLQDRDSEDHVAEELGDLLITLNEAIIIFDIEDNVRDWYNLKLDRLRTRMESGNG